MSVTKTIAGTVTVTQAVTFLKRTASHLSIAERSSPAVGEDLGTVSGSAFLGCSKSHLCTGEFQFPVALTLSSLWGEAFLQDTPGFLPAASGVGGGVGS